MGVNGLLPRILPSAGRENYDLRALSDGLITIFSPSAPVISSSSSSSSTSAAAVASSSTSSSLGVGGVAGPLVNNDDDDETNDRDHHTVVVVDNDNDDDDDNEPAPKKKQRRRKSSSTPTTSSRIAANKPSKTTKSSSWSRRKVRIAVDINGWIARASHGYGGFLMDERHLSYHGRAELNNERRLAREPQQQQHGENGGEETNSDEAANNDNDKEDDDDHTEQFQKQQQRLEYVTKCTSFVLQRIQFLREDCSALVLPVLDGLTPPVKRKMVRTRSERRTQATEVRDEVAVAESRSSSRPAAAAAAAATNAMAAANTGTNLENDNDDGDDDDDAEAQEITEAARTEAEVLRRISASKRAGTGNDHTLRREIVSSLLAEFRKRSWPVLVAPYEADGQLAYLANNCRAVDLVVTEDSDLIASGVPRLVYRLGGWNGKNDANRSSRHSDSGGGGGGNNVLLLRGTLLRRSDLGSSRGLDLRDFSDAMLAAMFVAAGCDYCDSLRGIGIVTSRNIVKKAFHGCEAEVGMYHRRRRGGGEGNDDAPVLRMVLNDLFRSCSNDVRARLLPLDDPEKEGLRLAYERSFLAALALYRHPVVYDPVLGEHVIANDVSVDASDCSSRAAVASSLFRMEEEILMEYEPYRDLVSIRENLYQVVGAPMPPNIARGVAEGLIDPRQLPTQDLRGERVIDTCHTELPNMDAATAEGENNASSLQAVDEGAEFGDLMTQGSSVGGGRFELATQETIGAGSTQQSKSSSGTSGMISSLSPDLLASPSPQRGS